jgi:ammonium transporter, Amt family
MNTVLACSMSGIINCFISFRKSQTEVFDLIAGMNGLICGYVSICSCCHNVECWAAILIGAMGSVLQEFFRRTLRRLEIDDPMDSISTHGICGFWSLIALGLFENDKGILLTGNGETLGVQFIGAASLILLSTILSLIFFYPLKRMGRLRTSKIQEIIGMDIYLK